MRDAAGIRSMFATVSRRYDLLNHLLSLNRDKYWRRKAVEISGPRKGDAVLDVCSGTADLAMAYSDGVGPEGLVVGTDFCPEMLLIGKQKLGAERGGARVELMVADTLDLPFPDGVFDVVSVAFGIRNVSDYEAGIREMARVAKEGGRVVILEFSLPETGLFNKIYMTYFTRVLPIIGRRTGCLAERHRRVPLPARIGPGVPPGKQDVRRDGAMRAQRRIGEGAYARSGHAIYREEILVGAVRKPPLQSTPARGLGKRRKCKK